MWEKDKIFRKIPRKTLLASDTPVRGVGEGLLTRGGGVNKGGGC